MKRKLKILIVSNLYPPYIIGGAEIVTSHFAEALTKEGHEVVIFTSIGSAALQNEERMIEKINNVKVIRIHPKNLYWLYEKGNPSSLAKGFWHLKDAWNSHVGRSFRKIIDEESPDIIHTNNIDSFSPIVWEEGRNKKIPVVHTAHDYHLVCPRATLVRRNGEICNEPGLICNVYRSWYMKMSNKIDLFVGPSDFIVNLHKDLNFKAKEFVTIPNGIPSKTELTFKRERINSHLKLLYLGQLTKHKGVDILINAIKSLPKEVDFELNIAGQGHLQEEIQLMEKIDSRIKFHGFVKGNEKEELLINSDLIVLPSCWYENAPISIIEAYQKGVAIIASRIGGIPEMVKDKETGFLFEPGNHSELARSIKKLTKDKNELLKLQNNASKMAEKYTVDQMKENYLEQYRRLLVQ